jgi:hypothetical protein
LSNCTTGNSKINDCSIPRLNRDRALALTDLEYHPNQLSLSHLADRSRIVAKLERCE